MSTLSSSHTLIAAGTEDVQVRLCDITSGAFSHTLSGHRGMSMVSISKFILYFFFESLLSVFHLFGKHKRFLNLS